MPPNEMFRPCVALFAERGDDCDEEGVRTGGLRALPKPDRGSDGRPNDDNELLPETGVSSDWPVGAGGSGEFVKGGKS